MEVTIKDPPPASGNESKGLEKHQEHDGDVPSKTQPAVPWGMLFSTADNTDKWMMLVGVIGALGNGMTWPIFAILFKDFTNAFGDPDADFMKPIRKVALDFLYLAIASLVGGYLQTSLFMWSGNRQASRIRMKYLQATLRQDVAYFDSKAVAGVLLQGLNDDTRLVQNAISEKVANLIQYMTCFVGGLIIAFVGGWDMTLVMIGMLPFMMAAGITMAKVSEVMTSRQQAAMTTASSIAQQMLAQIRNVVAYGGEKRAVAQYGDALVEPTKVGVRGSLYVGLGLGSVMGVLYFMYAAAFMYGAWRVSTGNYDPGKVLQVFFAALMASFNLGQAAPIGETIAKGCAAGARLFDIINRKPPIEADSEDGEKPSTVDGRLELANVHFSYATRPDVRVLQGLSLVVPSGTSVALVGSSGSGKSTVVQLVERFYDPSSGAVLLDGKDLRFLNLRWLRQQMGLVAQEPTLFATSIFENIAMGKEGATQEEVVAAARAANAHNFITNLPNGYETQVGERGVQMSGGQKQRIAIARAVLKDPRILLLDEATSALDTASEKIVQAALDKLMVGRTSVVIAHRLSTVRGADSIAVIRAGQVVEQGPHAELIKNTKGAYNNLVRLQMTEQQRAEEEESGGEAEEEEDAAQVEDGADLVLQVAAQSGKAVVAVEVDAGGGGDSSHSQQAVVVQLTSPDSDGSMVAAPALSPVNSVGMALPAAASAPYPITLQAADSGPPGLPPRYPIPHTSTPGTGKLATAGSSGGVGKPARVSREGATGSEARVSGSGTGNAKKTSHDGRMVTAHSVEDSIVVHVTNPAGKADKQQQDEEDNFSVPVVRLARMNTPEWPYAVVGTISSAITGSVQPIYAFMVASIIVVIYNKDMDQLLHDAKFWSWMFFMLGCVMIITSAITQWTMGKLGSELARRLRLLLFTNMLHQEIGWFDADQNASGVLATRLGTDASYVRGAVADNVTILVQCVSALIAGYVIAFIYDWRIALVMTIAMPFIIAGMVIWFKMTTGAISGSDKLFGGANQSVSEAVSSIRIVHAFNLQDKVVKLYDRLLSDTVTSGIRKSHLTGVLVGYSQAVVFAGYSLAIWFGGVEVNAGRVDFEGMMKAFLALMMAAMGIGSANAAFPDLGKAKDAVRSIIPLLDRKTAIDASSEQGHVGGAGQLVLGTANSSGASAAVPPLSGAVSFRDVGFAYPQRATVQVFRRFNLDIPAGNMVALVGESGAGKSTVVGLLLRYYDVQSGSVVVDGRDLREYRLSWLRSQMALVSQEPLLFSTTIGENIRYGRPDASQEEVEAAARAANAHEFISQLPEGYNTEVGERGIQLSGGQKQRVAIARAVLKDPRILILDEATSALDAHSEKVVQQALDVIMVGRTSVVVAHRLSTIRNAHKIAVVHKGRVAEQGTHAELMARGADGIYARLVAAQTGVAV